MLETSALACERGGLRLFSGLDLSLAQGGLLRVRGANGSGKTTLLRALAGLTRPAEGEVRWRGKPIDADYRREMLFLGHAPAVTDELTVLENLQFSAQLSGLKGVDCKSALERLGIARLAGLPARYLSQGQRRRAALARLALAASLPLWLLDEPFAALDAEGIAQVSGLCGAHLAAGGMLVLTSHQEFAIEPAVAQSVDSEADAVDAFAAFLRRDLRIALRRKGDVLNVLAFFVVVASLFPLGIGPEPEQLRAIGAGVVWIAALLAALLSLPRLFAADHADGTLEQMLASPQPLLVVVLAKTAAHWLSTGLPLALAAPLIGLQYGLPADALALLIAALLIGTPVLSLLGAAGAALTLGVRGGGALLGLLLLPLYVPVLVFGAGAVGAALTGINPGAHLSLLGAFLAVSSVVGPWAACAALRVALD